MTEITQTATSKRGLKNVILALLAAALIMSPSYLAAQMTSRLKLDISIVAIVSLAIFLVGLLVLVKVLKD
jgi:hypothetical protein